MPCYATGLTSVCLCAIRIWIALVVNSVFISVTRCYLALTRLGLQAACARAPLALLALVWMCNRELDCLVNIGLLPHVIVPEACFSKVPKLSGRISGDIILFLSSKRGRLGARNLAVIFIFIPFTT